MATDLPLIYLAGPYTNPDPVMNTHDAIGVACALQDSGFVVPYIPHLSLLWHLVRPRPLEFWYEYDLAILSRCDALLRYGGTSDGADREVAYAIERGIPVFADEDALLKWAADR